MRVAVLGCGPTGLLVAHAVQQAGHEPAIYSHKQKSSIPGSQHLHGPVPNLTPVYPEGSIQFVRLGSGEDYARKVYGDWTRATGWDNYFQVYPSWNVVKAYDQLWFNWKDFVQEMNITPTVVCELQQDHDLVISTVPAQTLCTNPDHNFKSVCYWIQRLPTPIADEHNEIVVYNGLPEDPWYRWSILGGRCSIEYPEGARVPPSAIAGYKAIDTDCDCLPGVERCGRWGEWRHGVTMFKAYEKAVQLMEGASVGTGNIHG